LNRKRYRCHDGLCGALDCDRCGPLQGVPTCPVCGRPILDEDYDHGEPCQACQEGPDIDSYDQGGYYG